MGGGGLQEIDELFKMFKVLGTPNEQLWPGVSRFPDYMATFPKWPPRPIHEVLPLLLLSILQCLAKPSL